MIASHAVASGIVAALVLAPAFLYAQEAEPTLPPELEGVGVDEHLNAELPRDAVFRDHTGRRVRLGDFFNGQRPAVLAFVYHSCPRQCSVLLSGLVNSLRGIDWMVGREFDAIALSIDPRDSESLAAARRNRTIQSYGRAGSESGWHFLLGTNPEIRRVADAAGFRFRWYDPQQQFLHAAVIVLVTPGGRVARYLYGVNFEGRDLRLGLFEASEGRSMSSLDRFISFCFQFDGRRRRYVVMARRVMQIGGGLTALALGAFLATLWIRDRRRSARDAALASTAAVVPEGPSASEAVSQ